MNARRGRFDHDGPPEDTAIAPHTMTGGGRQSVSPTSEREAAGESQAATPISDEGFIRATNPCHLGRSTEKPF